MKRAKLLSWTGGLLLLLFLGVLLLMRDYQVEPITRRGHLWTGTVAEAPVLLYVTDELRGRSYRRRSSTSWSIRRYHRFTLESRRLPGGDIVASAALGERVENEAGADPVVLGVHGNVVWLWRNKLEARSLSSLEVVADTSRFAAASPQHAALLPNDPAQYRVLRQRGLLVRATDARLYLVNAETLSLTAVSADELPSTTLTTRSEGRFDFIYSPGQSEGVTSPYNRMLKSFVTSKGDWYALLSESEFKGVSKRVRAEDHPSGDVARSFYKTTYVFDGRHAEIDPGALKPVGDLRLIQAGFMTRGYRALWDVADPSSSLVLHKEILSQTAPWVVSRVARDGAVVWKTSTGLAAPEEFLDANSHFVVAGRLQSYTTAGPKGDHRERIVWINEKTGDAGTLIVSTGEVARTSF